MEIKDADFGDYCTIEQKRYVGPNEFYGYKVVGRKKSNAWTDVPVDANNDKETLHDHMEDVVTAICNNLDDRTVHQFRVSDLTSVMKAKQVPEGFVLVPKILSDDVNDQLWDFMRDNFSCCDEDGNEYMTCEDFDLNMFYKAMIEVREQKG